MRGFYPEARLSGMPTPAKEEIRLQCVSIHVKSAIMQVATELSDLDRLLDEMIELRHGMRVGDFSTYTREIEKRSFARSTVQLVLGLIAIYWGRATFAGLDFDFSDQLEIANGETTHQLSLSRLDAYQTIGMRSSALESDWLNAIVRTYSSEYAELMPRLEAGIVDEIELKVPTIHIDAD